MKKAILLHDSEHAYQKTLNRDFWYPTRKLVTNGLFRGLLIFMCIISYKTGKQWFWLTFVSLNAIFIIQYLLEINKLEQRKYFESPGSLCLAIFSIIFFPFSLLYLCENSESDVSHKDTAGLFRFSYKEKTFGYVRGGDASSYTHNYLVKPMEINPGFLMKIWMIIFRKPKSGSREDRLMDMIIAEKKKAKETPVEENKNLLLGENLESNLLEILKENSHLTLEDNSDEYEKILLTEYSDRFIQANPMIKESIKKVVENHLKANSV